MYAGLQAALDGSITAGNHSAGGGGGDGGMA